jgi:uncharacterized protein (TIGR03067 family)
MNAMMLGLAFVASAPAPKDQPKKIADIVGEWVVETMTLDGKHNSKPSFELVYNFTVDGDWLARRDGVQLKTTPRRIEVDSKSKPSTVDVIYSSPRPGAPAPPNMYGIYKIDGDTLTICFGPERPKDFGPPEDKGMLLMTFKRLKKKD